MHNLFRTVYWAVKHALSAPIDPCCDGCESGGPCQGCDDGGGWSATKPPVKLPGPVWNPASTPWGNGGRAGGPDPTIQHPEGPSPRGHFDASGHWVVDQPPTSGFVTGTLGPGGVWQGADIPGWQEPHDNPGQDPTHNNPAGAAPRCPPGYTWTGFSCESQFGDHQCPVGQHFDVQSQSCRPNAGPIVNCPQGYRAQNGMCVPIVRGQSAGAGYGASEGQGGGMNTGGRVVGGSRGVGSGPRYNPGSPFGAGSGGARGSGRGLSFGGDSGGSGMNTGGRSIGGNRGG